MKLLTYLFNHSRYQSDKQTAKNIKHLQDQLVLAKVYLAINKGT